MIMAYQPPRPPGNAATSAHRPSLHGLRVPVSLWGHRACRQSTAWACPDAITTSFPREAERKRQDVGHQLLATGSVVPMVRVPAAPNVFCSVNELTTAPEDWIKTWNARARPSKGTKTADQIIDRICRYCSRISGPGH